MAAIALVPMPAAAAVAMPTGTSCTLAVCSGTYPHYADGCSFYPSTAASPAGRSMYTGAGCVSLPAAMFGIAKKMGLDRSG